MADVSKERVCKTCGKLLVRSARERLCNFAKRRFCSRLCAGRFRHRNMFSVSRGIVIEYGNALDKIDEDIVG
jgi:hypothetical protein